MKQSEHGVWLPDGEEDKIMLRAGFKYQGSKLAAAMEFLPTDRRRVALDIGAHCGLWTIQLLQRFKEVHCFEPIPAHLECWKKNVVDYEGRVHLHETALGNQSGTIKMKVMSKLSGRSRVEDGEQSTEVSIEKLDFFNIEDVDLVKIDVEGYEKFVLEGGINTLLVWRPVVIVEQKEAYSGNYGLEPRSAVKFLESYGMHLRREIVGDFILNWD